MGAEMSVSEVSQLQQLKLVADNPEYAGMWRSADCDRLTALGYARPNTMHIGLYDITPEGRAALARLEV